MRLRDRVARRVVLRTLGRMRTGGITVVEGADRTTIGQPEPHAVVEVLSDRAWWRVLRGSRGLGAAFGDGDWDTPDLVAVISLAARNAEQIDDWRRRWSALRVPFQRLRGALTSNTPKRSRKDIAAHYDLGNELFGRMLDPTMTYSSAWFQEDEATLEQAQIAKLELICDKLDLGPDKHVLEIGTGWGGFAIHAARTRGCRVTTTTLSKEQRALAMERIAEAGLEDRVTVLLSDYRELSGSYDAVVSIEMIEAVGWKNFGVYFERCSQLLSREGAMLLQAIVHDDRAYEVEKASRSSFIRTYIFPNGCLPSLAVISRCLARKTDLRTVHLQDLTPSYPPTLRQWRKNFEAAADELRGLGYDDRFQRLWRLYLAYCEAGFAERRIRVVQALLAKPRWPGAKGLRGAFASAPAGDDPR
jgi:cyclopropane-fatty-acyl-phospholipid synthase